VADIIYSQSGLLQDLIANSWKRRTLYALSRCRTAAMGGHVDRCNHQRCHRLHISYNSCRNRHCPKCQGHLREQWIEAREADLLNTSYFHVVFTLPDHLNEWALCKPKLIYDLLFKTAWQVINDFGANPKFLGAKTGMVSVLHTWGQNLSLHPHLHCIVPAGGITTSQKWKTTRSKGKYLFDVKSMSKVFRSKYVAGLRKVIPIPKQVSEKLFDKSWVVYAKQPFHGPGQVIGYLGRYSHKIAISNNRIQAVKNGKVSFAAKDYRQGGKPITVQLSASEFVRRFALHILPKGFTRIRHFGILSSTSKGRCKELINGQIGKVSLPTKPSTLIHHRRCPICKKGILQTIMTFDQRGPPSTWFLQLIA